VGAEVTAIPHGTSHRHVRKRAAAVVLLAGRTYSSIADKALQVHGGVGYIWETEINRLYRAGKLWEIGAGTTEIRQVIIAEELLGL
jgi:isovaleryl-CoA dehydrogenase